MTTIKINGTDYDIKYTIRAIFIWENIMERPFELKTMMDNYVFFYSMILANNETVLNWDDFLNEIDTNPSLLTTVSQIIANQETKDRMTTNENDDKSTDKKKE